MDSMYRFTSTVTREPSYSASAFGRMTADDVASPYFVPVNVMGSSSIRYVNVSGFPAEFSRLSVNTTPASSTGEEGSCGFGTATDDGLLALASSNARAAASLAERGLSAGLLDELALLSPSPPDPELSDASEELAVLALASALDWLELAPPNTTTRAMTTAAQAMTDKAIATMVAGLSPFRGCALGWLGACVAGGMVVLPEVRASCPSPCGELAGQPHDVQNPAPSGISAPHDLQYIDSSSQGPHKAVSSFDESKHTSFGRLWCCATAPRRMACHARCCMWYTLHRFIVVEG